MCTLLVLYWQIIYVYTIVSNSILHVAFNCHLFPAHMLTIVILHDMVHTSVTIIMNIVLVVTELLKVNTE